MKIPPSRRLHGSPAVLHGGPTELLNTHLRPELPLPFGVVEGLTQNKRDEPLGVDFAQCARQGAKTLESDFRVCFHVSNLDSSPVGLITVSSDTSPAFARSWSSVVRK